MSFYKIILFILLISEAFGIDINVKIPKSRCSGVDIKENMSPKMSRHFSSPRDQDSIGWCYGFTAADLVSAEVGTPISAAHMSAVFNKNIDQNFFMRMGYNIGQYFISTSFDQVYEGGWVDRALKNSMKESVMCSEENFPFDKDYGYQVYNSIKNLENVKNSIAGENNNENTCYKLQTIKDELSLNLSLEQIYYALENNNLNTALSILARQNCRENLINIPKFKVKSLSKPRVSRNSKLSYDDKIKRVSKRVNHFFTEIESVLKSGKPLGISYNVKHIMTASGGHASVVTGRRWKNGKCQFKIRNSWGKTCSSYDSSKIEDCDYEEGSFWVSDQKFYDMASNIDFIGQ